MRTSSGFEGLTLPQVICVVMGDRAMTATELTVAMLEAGYVTQMDRNTLRNAVSRELREGEFRKEGGQ